MDVLCEFIAKTQPKEWAKYTKYYGTNAEDKLYHRLETTISNQGLLYVLRNGIEDMGCKLKVCFFKPESELTLLLPSDMKPIFSDALANSAIPRLTLTPLIWYFPLTASLLWRWN